jgi:hypothetical protein
MGKLLKTFILEVQPDDIMSYADLEWSQGDVYKTLGFNEELPKDPVSFEIDPQTWERRAIRRFQPEPGTTQAEPDTAGKLFYTNFGSRKLRLKLTDYQ